MGRSLPAVLPSEKETDEWSAWTPCSVTCGHGERKRTKSCGYSCTLTEASRCDQEPCPGEWDPAFFRNIHFNSLWWWWWWWVPTLVSATSVLRCTSFVSSLLFVDDVNTVVEPFPFEMENGTEPFGTGGLSSILHCLHFLRGVVLQAGCPKRFWVRTPLSAVPCP